MSDQQAYIDKYKAQLDQWEAEIESLKAKAAETSAETRIEYEKQIGDLQEKISEHRRKMEEASEAGSDAWQELKAGLDKAFTELQSAWDKAVSRFR